MTFIKVLQYFFFAVFTALCFKAVQWLLNQPSDYLLIIAGLILTLYGWLAIKTKFFTKNPFK